MQQWFLPSLEGIALLIQEQLNIAAKKKLVMQVSSFCCLIEKQDNKGFFFDRKSYLSVVTRSPTHSGTLWRKGFDVFN